MDGSLQRHLDRGQGSVADGLRGEVRQAPRDAVVRAQGESRPAPRSSRLVSTRTLALPADRAHVCARKAAAAVAAARIIELARAPPVAMVEGEEEEGEEAAGAGDGCWMWNQTTTASSFKFVRSFALDGTVYVCAAEAAAAAGMVTVQRGGSTDAADARSTDLVCAAAPSLRRYVERHPFDNSVVRMRHTLELPSETNGHTPRCLSTALFEKYGLRHDIVRDVRDGGQTMVLTERLYPIELKTDEETGEKLARFEEVDEDSVIVERAIFCARK